MRAGRAQVSREAAWAVMSCIDFRAAAECGFHRDIIRTEKLDKIAAVLNNQDKGISLTPPPDTHTHTAVLLPVKKKKKKQ